jgi:hypothetical protein
MKTIVVIISILTTVPRNGTYQYFVKEIEYPDQNQIISVQKEKTGFLYSPIKYNVKDTINLHK